VLALAAHILKKSSPVFLVHTPKRIRDQLDSRELEYWSQIPEVWTDPGDKRAPGNKGSGTLLGELRLCVLQTSSPQSKFSRVSLRQAHTVCPVAVFRGIVTNGMPH
jgi:hypothetical protein